MRRPAQFFRLCSLSGLLLVATGCTLAAAGEKIAPSLLDQLGGKPATCPAGLEAYGRAEGAACGFVDLRLKDVKAAVRRFLRMRARRFSTYLERPWQASNGYQTMRAAGPEILSVLFNPDSGLLIAVPDWSCFGQDRLDKPRPVMAGEDEEVTQPPTRIAKVSPAYPEEARASKISGIVVSQAIIGKNGDIVDFCLVDVEPSALGFEREAERAIRQWRYKPALKDGAPVELLTTIVTTFRVH